MDRSPDDCRRIVAARDARFDGRLVVGVHTTGIYCRPVCPARTPKPEHVSCYPSAAAARQAGLRPCLRCRPELAPEVTVWPGTPRAVVRALRLIEAGALDDGNQEPLAARLGMSDGDLHRLFQQHLGASPLAVAHTRRLHLALQLLHDTTLAMPDVALASGFGGERGLNETCQRLFRRPPASLRRAGRAAPVSTDAVTIQLACQPPFDWAEMVSYFQPRTIPGVETVADGRYARTIALDGHIGTLVVEAGTQRSLRLTIQFPDLAALPRIIARVRRMFDLAANPELIGAHLAADPLLAPMVAHRPGLRVPGAWDGFELAVRAILGQQITVAGATRLSGVIVTAFGTPVDDSPAPALGLTHQFPTPAQLADADVAGLGLMPGSRARAISALARAAAADPALFDADHDLEGTVARLRSLPGIGEWTAQYIALRAAREPDAFPAADVGLLRAMAAADGQRPSPAALLARAEAWRPWRAYAALHLWASLPAAPTAPRRERRRDPHAA